MDDMNPIWILVAISEIVSLYLIYKIWRGSDYLGFKVVRTALALTPIVGPILYFFTGVPPKIMPPQLRDKPNETNYLDRGWRGNYLEKWQKDKPELERKIRELKKNS